MRKFRMEVGGGGLPSYPHPWLMPDFWQFPTVSMGLGPLMAIYQARFMKYLQGRGLAETAGRKVWCFLGDGETDEPESLGAISMAGREKLDNLIFVINCNLQRLDGPVRGNGKIIQELETNFRGAGWNVIKNIWGSRWDPTSGPGPRGSPPRADERGARRRLPDVQVAQRRLRPRALLRRQAGAEGDGRRHERRADLGAQPRRPRPAQGLRLLQGRVRAPRPADRDPREDDQGLRDGRGRRGPEHHPSAEEDERGGAARLPRSLRARADRPAGQGHLVLQAAGGLRRGGLHPRAPRGAGRLAARPPAQGRAAADAGAQRVPVPARRHRRPRGLHDDELRPDPLDDPARQAARQARRPDRPRRVAHVRHGGPVPPARHLQPGRPAVHARGPRPADVLPRGQARPGAPGGHQRGRRDVVVDRRGHVVLQPRRPDDPVLHLLLDVRLPAHRRPRVGRGRQPHARLHARRHRGPDDAQRRGPAARGRSFAPAERDDPQLHLLRPDLRVRAGGDHPRGPAPDDQRAGGRLLLPHADERELSAPGDAGGRGGGHPARDVPAQAGRPATAPRCR